MNSTINERINQIIMSSGKSVTEFAQNAGVPQTTLNEAATKTKDVRFSLIEKIYNNTEDIDANWLITGKGEMYKHNEAGRDNNVVEGDNKGIVGSGNTTGSIGGNHIQLGDTSNLKKIMNEEGVSIEFAQSVELLQQQNASLETRVSDLLAQLKTKDELLKAKDDMLEMYKSAIGKK